MFQVRATGRVRFTRDAATPFVSGNVRQTFQWDETAFAGRGGYKPKLDYLFNTELGWEFD